MCCWGLYVPIHKYPTPAGFHLAIEGKGERGREGGSLPVAIAYSPSSLTRMH